MSLACSYGTCLPRTGDGLLKYIGCPLNQGLNRMTRMLGDPMCVPDNDGNASQSLAKHDVDRFLTSPLRRHGMRHYTVTMLREPIARYAATTTPYHLPRFPPPDAVLPPADSPAAH